MAGMDKGMGEKGMPPADKGMGEKGMPPAEKGMGEKGMGDKGYAASRQGDG